MGREFRSIGRTRRLRKDGASGSPVTGILAVAGYRSVEQREMKGQAPWLLQDLPTACYGTHARCGSMTGHKQRGCVWTVHSLDCSPADEVLITTPIFSTSTWSHFQSIKQKTEEKLLKFPIHKKESLFCNIVGIGVVGQFHQHSSEFTSQNPGCLLMIRKHILVALTLKVQILVFYRHG